LACISNPIVIYINKNFEIMLKCIIDGGCRIVDSGWWIADSGWWIVDSG
jgi:hypothetical protein